MSSSVISANGLSGLLSPDKKFGTDSPNLSELLKAKTQQQPEQNVGIRPQVTKDDFHASAKGLQAAALSSSFQQGYAYSQTMSLQLTTKEGDQITVDFRQLYAQMQQQKSTQYAEQGPQGARLFESRQTMESTAFETRFGFSVTGNLNDSELSAVMNVFDQVDKLANQFYNGNIEKALEQAKNMNIDFGQLQSVSLDMNQSELKTTVAQQVAVYKQTQQTDVANQDAAGKDPTVADLPPYLQKWQSAIDSLDQQFADARSTFDSLLSGVLVQRNPEQGSQPNWFDRVATFHDKLAELANLDKITMKPSGLEIETPQAVLEKAQKSALDATGSDA